jgi:hypothetical protein
MKNKITIQRISKTAKTQKGFPDGPFGACLRCKCGKNKKGGACCVDGADFDKEAYNLLIKNRNLVEKQIGKKIEDCFEDTWLNDTDFLGGGGIASKKESDTCIFKDKNAGCRLADLIFRKKLPTRMLPTTCRIYPLLWDNGLLFVRRRRLGCICDNPKNKTKKSLIETQKNELEDVFCFDN